jgi:hypothetical protein
VGGYIMENKKKYYNNLFKAYIGFIINLIIISINIIIVCISVNKIIDKEINKIVILTLVWEVVCIIIVTYLLIKKIPFIKKRYLALSNIDNLMKNKKNTKDVILNKDELIKLNFNLIEMINYIIGLSNILIMIIMLIMISM